MSDPIRELFMEYAREPHQVAAGDGAPLLDHVSSYIRRYVSVSDPQLAVLTLWAVHTHLISEFDCTPYLAITSAEKESGKTRLLEVLKTLVSNPWLTGQVSPAVLFRTVDKKKPTLLLDESDATFKGDKEYAEALRGILNTGYRVGGVASRCVGQDFETKDFSTFCPKAIAGIGKLPGTIASRSIPIRLKRSPKGTVQRFRERDAELEAASIRGAIQAFADGIREIVGVARPALPDELSDRQQDAAESLCAIADFAGDKWPEMARTSLVSLCREAQADDDSIGHTLLADVRQVFESIALDRISSSDLASALGKIETSPWGEWNQGKPISPAKIARLLKPYGIKPQNLRIFHGYVRQDFVEAWSLYLPAESATSDTSDVSPSNVSTYAESESATAEGPVALSNPNKSNGIKGVSVVSLSGPGEGYEPDSSGPGCTCKPCGSHFGTVAGWRAHIVRGRCTPAGATS